MLALLSLTTKVMKNPLLTNICLVDAAFVIFFANCKSEALHRM